MLQILVNADKTVNKMPMDGWIVVSRTQRKICLRIHAILENSIYAE